MAAHQRAAKATTALWHHEKNKKQKQTKNEYRKQHEKLN